MGRPMLHRCGHPECKTLTLGELCVEHEPPVTKTFSRGRPYPQRPRPASRTLAGRGLI